MHASVGKQEVSSPSPASGAVHQQYSTVGLETAPVQHQHRGAGGHGRSFYFRTVKDYRHCQVHDLI